MLVLIYGNRKQDDMTWVFGNQKEKEAAFLQLFAYLDKEWKVYECSELGKQQQALYDKAKAGNGDAAIRLLTQRNNAEYETWRIEAVQDKSPDRISTPITLKPFFGEVKSVRTRREGNNVTVTLKMPKGAEIEFILVPHMTTYKDWEEVNGASHWVADMLQTEYSRDTHNSEGLKEGLSLINELRHALHYARNPELASPLATPGLFFDRVMRTAEAHLTKYSNTPLEKLNQKKRIPTTLDEAKEELAAARRTISSLEYALRKVPTVQVGSKEHPATMTGAALTDDIMKAAKRENKVSVV